MPFIFWASLAFLLGSAICVHFDVFGFRRRLTRNFLYVFNFVLPKTDPRGRRMKFGMAKTAAYVSAVISWLLLTSVFLSFGMPYSIGADENKFTGPLGDLFNGILTPVLTFLTFCGLLVTILIQNIQMKATLQELELTRNEMVKSNIALEAQVNSSKAQVKNSEAQKFDNNFYSLLDNHNKIMGDLSLKRSNVQLGGYLHSEKDSMDLYFFKFFSSKVYQGYMIDDNDAISEWSNNRDFFLPFFLVNYQILKYINRMESDILGEEDAKQYSNILRSLIPNSYQFLLMLNISSERFSDYKKLLKKYSIFEHFSFRDVKFKAFMKAAANVDLLSFGDCKRLRGYFEKEIYNVRGHLKESFLRYLKITVDKRYKSVEDDVLNNKYDDLCQRIKNIYVDEYISIFDSLNQFSVTNSPLDFEKFKNGDFQHFCQKDESILNAVENLRLEIAALELEYSM